MNQVKWNPEGKKIRSFVDTLLARQPVITFVTTIMALGLFAAWATDPAKTITWQMQTPGKVGNYKTTVLGNPLIVRETAGTSLSFNGIDDGLIVPAIPIEGWTRFTIEVFFKPDGTGPAAPRFIHFQDKDANRGTLEVRVTPKKTWYLDTFLKNGKTGTADKGLTLIDSTIQHPTDQWYWVALVYDGKRMSSYVNGVKELEGETNFSGVTNGEMSVGVRLNKVNWFKGLIREIRFHPGALDPLALQQP